MTVNELFDKNQIKYKRTQIDKGIALYKIGKLNVIIWINYGNIFKMERKCFDLLDKECETYALFMCDKKNNQYYYIKFPNKNNWLSGSFRNSDKDELFLGKQVLNYPSTLGKLVVDLKKYSL